MKTKYYLKVNEYVGLPKLNDFKLIEEDLNDELNADGKTKKYCSSLFC